MRVFVLTQGHLKQYRPEARFALDLPAGATVRDLIHASGIPWEEVGLAAVNGTRADDATALKDGDQVMLMAPLEGG